MAVAAYLIRKIRIRAAKETALAESAEPAALFNVLDVFPRLRVQRSGDAGCEHL